MAQHLTPEKLPLRLFNTSFDSPAVIEAALKRPTLEWGSELEEQVRPILQAVRARGDAALVEFTQRFDWQGCAVGKLKVSDEEIEAAAAKVPYSVQDALKVAKERLEQFHRRQLREAWFIEENGSRLGEIWRPIASVGMHVPGKRATYPSVVLHVGVPSKVAGVEKLYMATPPRPDGSIAPVVLFAAKLVGVDAVFRLGGAQAIAAFAFGTETVPKVEKIAGPGSVWVMVAKRLLYGVAGIDLLPGPSEIAVIADDSANPAWVASDLLAQAEHGEDSVAFLFTPSKTLAEAVALSLSRQLVHTERYDFAGKALKNYGVMVVTADLDEAVALCNVAAPEHVALFVTDPWALLPKLKHAGAVFIGPHSPVAAGDYLAGPSHVLPTGGAARFLSGLSVDDFLKKTSVVALSEQTLRQVGDAIITLAQAETLPAHAASIELRLKENAPRLGGASCATKNLGQDAPTTRQGEKPS